MRYEYRNSLNNGENEKTVKIGIHAHLKFKRAEVKEHTHRQMMILEFLRQQHKNKHVITDIWNQIKINLKMFLRYLYNVPEAT